MYRHRFNADPDPTLHFEADSEFRTGVKTMLIHMRILSPVLHMLENRQHFFTFICNYHYTSYNGSLISIVENVLEHIEIFTKKVENTWFRTDTVPIWIGPLCKIT